MGFLQDRLKLEVPIIQAPMAGVSTPAMAAAVSNAGALGSIGVGAVDAVAAGKMIAELRAATNKSFHVNVFCHEPAVADVEIEQEWLDYLRPNFRQFGAEPPDALSEIYKSFAVDEAMFRLMLDACPPVLSFHFGLPSRDKIAALKSAGILLMASATSLPEARSGVEAGMDAIIAQGFEAGGHRGQFDPSTRDEQLSTFTLVRQIVSNMDCPIIAAGGIMDGTGIRAMLDLGACGVQMGTAFVACDEASSDAAYRRALLDPVTQMTTMTAAISGRRARGLVNRFTAFGEARGMIRIPDYPIAYDAGKALNAAAKKFGETGYGAQWAGQGVALARAMPAAEMVATLRAELDRA